MIKTDEIGCILIVTFLYYQSSSKAQTLTQFTQLWLHSPAGPVELVLITLQKSVTCCSRNLPFQYSIYLLENRKLTRKATQQLDVKGSEMLLLTSQILMSEYPDSIMITTQHFTFTILHVHSRLSGMTVHQNTPRLIRKLIKPDWSFPNNKAIGFNKLIHD